LSRPRQSASVLSELDWGIVRELYDARYVIHRQLLALHEHRDRDAFAELALGITDQCGFSAARHRLGPKILTENRHAARRMFRR
jgi:hypothetical protein